MDLQDFKSVKGAFDTEPGKMGTRGDPRRWIVRGHNKFFICIDHGRYPDDEKEADKMGLEGSAIELSDVPTHQVEYALEGLQADRPTWEFDIELI